MIFSTELFYLVAGTICGLKDIKIQSYFFILPIDYNAHLNQCRLAGAI